MKKDMEKTKKKKKEGKNDTNAGPRKKYERRLGAPLKGNNYKKRNGTLHAMKKMEMDKEDASAGLREKYSRGPRAPLEGIRDKKLKGQLEAKEKLFGEAAITASLAEQWLLPSEGGFLEAEGLESTRHFTQEAIVNEVDVTSARKAFELNLPDLGPYALDYNLSGRYLILGGRKGHLAMMDWKQSRLVTELQVMETVRDVKFLHSEQFFAVAQKKYVYIYDKQGVEIHCLKDHMSILKLEFLPHHFLLVSTDKAGILRYQDTSTGQIVGQFRTRMGRCGVLQMNPYNSVVGLGHNNGTVTMWSPNMATPLVSMLCHRGPVSAVAFEAQGHQMVTAGMDGKVKVWDVRKYVPLHSYPSPTVPKALDISQKGLLAVGSGSGIEIWRDALAAKQEKPYMRHRLQRGSPVQDLVFCPYEDVLAVGHATGVSSLLVPGSGEPNFDTYLANPFENLKQRRETEVHKLLDKLQPEMIVLDPDGIGAVRYSAEEHAHTKQQQTREANLAIAAKAGKVVIEKNKTKGRNKSSKRHKRKMDNIIHVKRKLITEQKYADRGFGGADGRVSTVPGALARFSKK